jgi:ketosteroid isomerase-like protein
MAKMNSEMITLSFVERINAQDADGLAKLMTDNFRFIDYEGNIYEGWEKMHKEFASYFSSYPKYKIIVEKICQSGNDVAIIGTTTGSHAPHEIEAKWTLIWTAKIENNLVAEWRIYSDIEKWTKSK